MPLRAVVIVEGHGEDGAVRTLLERIWYELLGGDYIEVVPWRGKQGQLRQKEGLSLVVEAAADRLHATERADLRRLLLIMVDTEGQECPRDVAPARIACAREVRFDPATEIACVLPNPMFETWFAASANSLRGKNGLPDDLPKPPDPEGEGAGKGWLKKHLPRKYKETVDQPRFVGHMSLTECRDASRSFRRLVRETRTSRSAASARPRLGSHSDNLLDTGSTGVGKHAQDLAAVLVYVRRGARQKATLPTWNSEMESGPIQWEIAFVRRAWCLSGFQCSPTHESMGKGSWRRWKAALSLPPSRNGDNGGAPQTPSRYKPL